MDKTKEDKIRDVLREFNRKFWHGRTTESFHRDPNYTLTCYIDYQEAFDWLEKLLKERTNEKKV